MANKVEANLNCGKIWSTQIKYRVSKNALLWIYVLVRRQSQYDPESAMILLKWLVKLQPTSGESLSDLAIEANPQRSSSWTPIYLRYTNIHHSNRSSGTLGERGGITCNCIYWISWSVKVCPVSSPLWEGRSSDIAKQ